MTLPEKIQILRKKQGLSQEELAERLAVSRQSISKLEQGISQPEIEKAAVTLPAENAEASPDNNVFEVTDMPQEKYHDISFNNDGAYEQPKHIDIFIQARVFMFTAGCIEAIIDKNIKGENSFGLLLIPYIVNMSFACELLLKSLLSYSGRSINELHEHKLEELYNSLPSDLQDKIRIGIEPDNFREEKTFRKTLSIISDAFKKWRYCYENDNGELKGNWQFIKSFAQAVRNEADSIFEK